MMWVFGSDKPVKLAHDDSGTTPVEGNAGVDWGCAIAFVMDISATANAPADTDPQSTLLAHEATFTSHVPR